MSVGINLKAKVKKVVRVKRTGRSTGGILTEYNFRGMLKEALK